METNNPLMAQATIIINAPALKVWDALTKPELIKQYLFGTTVITEWNVGSPIIYEGQWQGKPYQDKGTILKIEPGKLLISTYWSSMAGLPDVPESYKTVRYELSSEGSGTRLTITRIITPTRMKPITQARTGKWFWKASKKCWKE